MNKNRFFGFIVMGLLSGGLLLHGKEVKKDVVITVRQSVVDGHDFFHKSRIEGGLVIDEWKIDGQVVDSSIYEERLLDAEKEEGRRAMRRERTFFTDIEVERQQARIQATKKLLGLSVHACLEELDQITKKGVNDFELFEAETFANQEDFDRFVKDFLPVAKKASESEELGEELELQHLLKRCEDYLMRLKKFGQLSMSRAIEKSDDPKVLKELLGALS